MRKIFDSAFVRETRKKFTDARPLFLHPSEDSPDQLAWSALVEISANLLRHAKETGLVYPGFPTTPDALYADLQTELSIEVLNRSVGALWIGSTEQGSQLLSGKRPIDRITIRTLSEYLIDHAFAPLFRVRSRPCVAAVLNHWSGIVYVDTAVWEGDEPQAILVVLLNFEDDRAKLARRDPLTMALTGATRSAG